MKSCPFCGHVGRLELYSRDIGGGDYRRVVVVGCKNSSCPVKPQVFEAGSSGYRHGDTQTTEEAEEKATARWNARAESERLK